MPSEVLAFVRPQLTEGPILAASNEFLRELHDGGWDISDHNIPTPTRHGLQIFEGWIEVDHGDDPDVHWVGEWRQLTHWEMCRVRFGLTPLRESPDDAEIAKENEGG